MFTFRTGPYRARSVDNSGNCCKMILMTKKLKPALVAALLAAALFALAGCNLISLLIGRKPVFEFASPEITVRLGDETTPEIVSSADETYTLESSDPEKVEIVDGVRIRGAGCTAGTAITARSGSGKTAECVVRVVYADLETLEIETADGNAVQLAGPGATSAERITFRVRTNANVSPDIGFSWRIVPREPGLEEQTFPDGREISFTPERKGVVYDVTVTAGTGIAASAECGFFDAVYLTFGKDVFGLKESVGARVAFLPSSFPFRTNPVTFTVTKNGEETEKKIAYTERNGIGYADLVLGVLPAGEYRVKVSYAYNGPHARKESNEVLFTVKDVAAIDRISVSVESGNLDQRATPSQVRLRAALSPSSAEVKRIVWFVNGEAQPAGAGSRDEFAFTPPKTNIPREYHITATADMAESRPVTVVYRPGSDPADRYVTERHYYGGYEQNAYITSQEEMNNIVRDALERQIEKLSIYVDYESLKPIRDKMDEARDSVEESGTVAPCEYTDTNTGEVEIKFDYRLDGGGRITRRPEKDPVRTRSYTDVQEPAAGPCYVEGTHGRNFYIDGVQETLEVDTSNMLYKAVSWGYRPKIAVGSGLTGIYANARSVLSKIITDDMTETEKVHAIYDWIVFNVRYDDDLASLGGVLNESMKCKGYYLEGVFEDLSDPHAVCDGKSKAFVLMCGMEGIRALRITGKAAPGNEENDKSAKKTGHAWNKVLLDPDEDGLKDWYLVDTTWGDMTVWNDTRTERTEYLTHAYFLLGDADVLKTHEEDSAKNYPKALGEYDYYAERTFKIQEGPDMREYDHKADNREELKAIMKNAKNTEARFIEVKLAYGSPIGVDGELQFAIAAAGIAGGYSKIDAGGNVYCVLLG